ncbi:MAG: MoaD/ThiS family protein [Staphylothermus sp.]|nr:MoaD/ThiS family protein [Staphylothermus sp.]
MCVKTVFLARAGDVVGKHIHGFELPEGATLRDLIKEIGEKLSRRFYEGVMTGRLVFAIFVNGKPVDELDYRLKDGDRVVFTTPEMGG